MNKAFLIGRLTRDAELRTTESGKSIAKFSLAVNRNYTNAEGEREADFINCVAFNKTGENLTKYTHKGSQIAVIGRIHTRNYDAQDGTKRYVTEISVDELTFLDKKEDKPEPTDSEIVQAVMNDEDPFKDFGNEIELTDDDLPW
jgi:single-strand DNA-binding protein